MSGIMESPDRNRIFLVYGDLDDMFIAPDLQKSGFRPYLAAYLKDLGYQQIVFYSGAQNTGKYVLDEESAMLAINANRNRRAKKEAARAKAGDVTASDGTPPAEASKPKKKRRIPVPGGKSRKGSQPLRDAAVPRPQAPHGGPAAAPPHEPQPAFQQVQPSQGTTPASVRRRRILSPRLSDIEGTGQPASAQGVAAAGHAAQAPAARQTICQPQDAGQEQAAKSEFVYSQPKITARDFLAEARRYMADPSIKTAVVFSFLHDFMSDPSAPLQQYSELLSHLWDEYSYASEKNENICILLAPQMNEQSIQDMLTRASTGGVLRDRFFNPNGSINEACTIRIGLPEEDELRNMLEYLRIVGDDGKRISFCRKDLDSIISDIAYISRNEDLRTKRGGQLQQVYARIVDYMRAQEGDVVTISAKDVRAMFGASGTYEPDPMGKLMGTRGWEPVARRIEQIVRHFARQRDLAEADQAASQKKEEPRLVRVSERLVGPQKAPVEYPMPHFVIRGNPGVGKTTVARLIGQIFKDAGLLEKGLTVEATAQDLISEYYGATATKTRQKLREADECVLFIDDAYSLFEKGTDSGPNYSQQAIDEIVAAMTNPKDSRFCLVMAGYPDDMDRLLTMNPGLTSRFGSANILTIDDYDPALLKHIFVTDVEGDGFELGVSDEDLNLFFHNLYAQRDRANFGNARDIVSIAKEVKMHASLRDMDGRRILREDFGPQQEYFTKRGASSIEEIYAELDKFVGLDFIRELFESVRNEIEDERDCAARGVAPPEYPDHYIFAGNPGTGKSTVGNLLGQLYHQLGALGGAKTIFVDASELKGTHVGDAEERTKERIQKAVDRNAVLFIDEAYQLMGDPYGEAAVDAMMTPMTEHAKDFKMVFGMYTSKVEQFLSLNPGLARRVRVVEFPDYTPEQLLEIFDRTIAAEKRTISDEARRLVALVLRHRYDTRREGFGNAGEVKRLVREMRMRLLARTRGQSGEARLRYQEADIPPEELRKIENEIHPRTLDDIMADLNAQVGLADLKRIVRKKRERLTAARLTGRPLDSVCPGYYFFVGNPGTGKSTSAKLFAECLHELGVIKTDRFESCTAKDLVGEYVGQSGPKAAALLEKSRNGVLFIDEAYGLSYADDPSGGSFKKDALEQVIAFMDDPEHRGSCCIIFAGYEKDMDGLYRSNSGMRSRVEEVRFEDFTPSQMVEIFRGFCEREGYALAEGVAEHYLPIFAKMRQGEYFSNGRTARTVFERTTDNWSSRIASEGAAGPATICMADVLGEDECMEIVS